MRILIILCLLPVTLLAQQPPEEYPFRFQVFGAAAAPLYEFLKREARGLMGSKAIKWNFTKFLVDREGNVVKRFGPQETPEGLRGAVEALL